MISKRNLAPLAALFLTIWFGGGCGPKTPSAPTQANAAPSSPAQTDSSVKPPLITDNAVSNTPIKDAVEKLLTQQNESDHPFIPKGTKLLGAVLKEGVVSLDFSHEFNALADRGDNVESQAQKSLRRALASIPGVEKMRVTVEGKPFESQATDWNTPFPVRETAGDSEGSTPDTREVNASNRGRER